MYYPKNKIKTGLISNGDLIYKNSKQPYSGVYFKTYDGKYYAGETPNYANLVELTISLEKLNLNSEVNEFDKDSRFDSGNNETYSTQINVNEQVIPKQPKCYKSEPTAENYRNGSYIKYFAKKTNESIFLEISNDTYNKLKSQDPSLLWPLYNCLYMNWSLKSSLSNLNLASQIERDNNWRGFVSYLKLTNTDDTLDDTLNQPSINY